MSHTVTAPLAPAELLAGTATVPGLELAHHAFECQARRHPDRPALRFGAVSLTYRELNDRAEGIADRLRGLGVGPGALVGIVLNRSERMVAALLGVLKSGAGYVPLDPAYPTERLKHMLDDSGVGVVLTERSLVAGLPGFAGRVHTLDDNDDTDTEPSAISDAPRERPDPASAVAYVIYTSGSTGKPKGVQVPHRAVTNFLTSMAREPGLGPDDVLAAVTTLCFDIHVLEVLLPLSVGATLHVVGREVATDGVRLLRLLRESGATVMQATPATWRMLLDAGWSPADRLGKALCGGEAMPRKLADDLLARCGEVWNLYGPTETTVWSTALRVEPGAEAVALGHPIDNTTLLVLDDQFRPVPEGQEGELFIGGLGVTLGYLNRPELTAEKFVRDPATGDRVYRTGDLVRVRAGGALEYLGRIDHQVKIRGYRVELGEIESALERHPAARQAVVSARDDGRGGHRLVAYLIPAEGVPRPPHRELAAYLAETLPPQMIPSAFVYLSEFPQTPNGKTDRKRLPEPPPRDADPNRTFEPPADDREAKLKAIWEQVLGVAPIGVDEDFRELGGTSLHVVRIQVLAEQQFGRSFFPTDILAHPTVRALAARIGMEAPATPGSAVVRFREGTGAPLFLVHGIGGTALDFTDLVADYPPGRPILALRARGLDGREAPFERIEAMASYYADEVRAAQGKGPYLIVGWSFGGLPAYEVARQLVARGESVAFLGVLDQFAPHAHDRDGRGVRGAASVAWRFTRWAVGGLTSGDARGHLKEVAREVGSKARRATNKARQSLGLPEVATAYMGHYAHRLAVYSESLKATLDAHFRATLRYDPEPFPGPLHLYRTCESPRFHADRPDRGWGRLAQGGVTVHTLDCHHDNIVRPPASATVASLIEADIARALAASAEQG